MATARPQCSANQESPGFSHGECQCKFAWGLKNYTMFYSKHFFLIARQKKAIKLARLRRNIPVEVIANRSGLGRTTIWAVEKGSPSVAMGAYAKVLHAIEGMDKDLLLICKDDAKGRLMQKRAYLMICSLFW